MLGLLRAILAAIGNVLGNQQEAASLAAADKADLDRQIADLSAAVEHLRVLVEGDTLPTSVGVPTFTAQE